MAMTINTNIHSLFAQRSLNNSQSALQTSLQRLSTGIRINSAKDDAAGLYVVEKMTSDIRGLNQATRNVQDGISLAQTTEGTLGQLTKNLQRLREISVQVANGTLGDAERQNMRVEGIELVSQIQQVTNTQEFAWQRLLDGTLNLNIQAGHDGGSQNQVQITANSAKASALGATTTGVKADYVANTDGAEIGYAQAGTSAVNAVNATMADQTTTITWPGRSETIVTSDASGNKTAYDIVAAINALGTAVSPYSSDGVIATGSNDVAIGNITKAGLSGTEGDGVSFDLYVTPTANTQSISFLIGQDTATTQTNYYAALDTAISTINTANGDSDLSRSSSRILSAGGKGVSLGNFQYTDNAGVKIGSFANTAPAENISLDVDGTTVTFAKGVTATNDMNNLYSAINSTLSSATYTWRTNAGDSTVVLSRQGGGNINITNLADAGGTNASATVSILETGSLLDGGAVPVVITEGGDDDTLATPVNDGARTMSVRNEN